MIHVAVTALVDTVHAKEGDYYKAREGGDHRKGPGKRAKVEKPESKRTVVPSHLLLTDVSQVKEATHLFKDLVFRILVHFHTCLFL